MDYKKNQIKEGINLHVIQTEKFKTNIISIFLTLPLTKENITKEALISAVLRRGNMHYNTSEEMSIALEEMYGAGFDCGIEKMGDTHVLKFYIETVNEEFLPTREDILKNGVNMLCDIVFNPLVINGAFKDDYVEMEKNNLKQIIERKIDNKGRYALERCIEEMYKNKPYGLYKYGYVEDLSNINSQNLYETYIETIKSAKIDIFVSGKIENEDVKNIFLQNEQINKLDNRQIDFIKDNKIQEMQTPDEITEELDITQAKLVMGLIMKEESLEDKYLAIVYNTILGGGANSKLFQNVREKASLAYSAGSNYVRQKGNIFIRLGIETSNYDKAKEIIMKQLEDMKNGEFSEEDLNNAKTTIIATIDFIPDEQDTQISYYFGQEFTGKIISIDEYKQKIQNITKDQVVEFAKNIQLHTTYFLKGKEE